MQYNPNLYGYGQVQIPYQPMYQPQSQPQMQLQPQQAQVQQQSDQLNNGGLIVVSSEDDVKKYPVAPGNLVTFRIENQPIVIEKSMGRSQFDSPHYEKYKLIKEGIETEATETLTSSEDLISQLTDIKKTMDHIDVQLDILKDNYQDMKKSLNKIRKGKEDEADD